MKRIIKKVIYSVLASAIISALPVYADTSTALKLEKAQMKYILSYQALQKAKQTPNQQGNLAKFVKNYRESYAQYLQLLSDKGLYKPTERDFDPADDYNDQEFAATKKWQNWESINPNDYVDLVNSYVEQGKAPDDVIKTVMNQIPENTYSEEINTVNTDNAISKDNTTKSECPGGRQHKPRDGKHHHRRKDKSKSKPNMDGVWEEVYTCSFCGQDYPAKK